MKTPEEWADDMAGVSMTQPDRIRLAKRIHADGYRAGLEAATRICDDLAASFGPGLDTHATVLKGVASRIFAASALAGKEQP